MTSSTIIALLREKRLRLTDGRKEILEVLYDSEVALSHIEIGKMLPISIDRVTAYRTLISFRERGLVHAILDPHSGTVKYCLNRRELPVHHAHFKCECCHALTCLPINIEQLNFVEMPQEYVVRTYAFFIEGVCDKCESNVLKEKQVLFS